MRVVNVCWLDAQVELMLNEFTRGSANTDGGTTVGAATDYSDGAIAVPDEGVPITFNDVCVLLSQRQEVPNCSPRRSMQMLAVPLRVGPGDGHGVRPDGVA